MAIKLYPTPGDLLRDNSAFFEKHEVQAQLNLGNAAAHMDEPCTPALLFGRVELSGKPVLLFGNTLPWRLCLNAAPGAAGIDKAITELAGCLHENSIEITGVTGRDSLCRAFMKAYGGEFRLREALNIMVLETLIEPPPCPGTVQKAAMPDLDLIVDWKCALIREAIGEEPVPEQLRETTLDQLKRSVVWLMRDPSGEPVSMADSGRMLERGACVSGVYTPPQHRGNGYCKVTVAALCRELLACGKSYVTLFVDKKNPISDRVYRKIGFDILEDSSDYRLV